MKVCPGTSVCVGIESYSPAVTGNRGRTLDGTKVPHSIKVRKEAVSFGTRLMLRATFVFLSSGILLLAGCSADAGKPVRAQGGGAVPVTVATVEQKNMPVLVQAIGSVDAYSIVGVKSQVTGELVGVHFQEGQDVQKGDLL